MKYSTSPLLDRKGEPLKAGDLKVGRDYKFVYDEIRGAYVLKRTTKARPRSAPAAKRSR